MAKHKALGRGMDALMAENQSFEPQNENSADEFFSHDIKEVSREPLSDDAGKSLPVVKVTANLPEGISSDENGTLWVDPMLLKPNPHQPRQYFDEEKLRELTESVKLEGVLSPIIIEDVGDGTFYIIAGERRTRAARAAGLSKVPVQLRKYTDSRKLEVALVENIQRTDLNPVEEALAYAQLMQMENITQEEVALKVGKNRSTVTNSLRLLKLPEDMLQSLAAGNITAGHARSLLSVVNPADQRVLYGRILGQGLSVRQCEQQATELNGGARTKKKSGPRPQEKRDPNLVAMEQEFIQHLGTKVQIKGNFDRGSVNIEYFSADDLDRLYRIILGNDKDN